MTSFRTESQHAHANANNTGKAASMHAEVPKRIFPLALLPEAQQTSVAELDLRLTRLEWYMYLYVQYMY